jgi:predicted GNAT family acetyltransferase
VGRIDGAIACVLDYADNGCVVSMTRTFTNPPYRRRGLAAELVAFAVDGVEAQGKRVRPMCWYVSDWFEAHPERAGLLA